MSVSQYQDDSRSVERSSTDGNSCYSYSGATSQAPAPPIEEELISENEELNTLQRQEMQTWFQNRFNILKAYLDTDTTETADFAAKYAILTKGVTIDNPATLNLKGISDMTSSFVFGFLRSLQAETIVLRAGLFFSSKYRKQGINETALLLYETEYYALQTLGYKAGAATKEICKEHRRLFRSKKGISFRTKEPLLYKIFWEYLMKAKLFNPVVGKFILSQRKAFKRRLETQYKQFESAIREQFVGARIPAMAILLGIPEGIYHVEDALDVGKSMDGVLAIENSERNLLQVKHGREGEYVDNRCIFNFNIDNLMDFHDPDEVVSDKDKTLIRREVISKVMQFVLGLYFKQTPPSMTVSLTVALFFKFVTPFQVAYVWSLLIRQSIKNRSSGCQNHAGEIQLMDKCSTYLTHWSNCEGFQNYPEEFKIAQPQPKTSQTNGRKVICTTDNNCSVSKRRKAQHEDEDEEDDFSPSQTYDPEF